MNKWMIWGENPYFLETPNFFHPSWKKRSRKRIYTLSSLKLRVVQELFFVGGKDLNCGRCVDFLLGVFFPSDLFWDFFGFGICWTTNQIILLGRSNFPQDLPKIFLVSIRKSVYVPLKMLASNVHLHGCHFWWVNMAPQIVPIFFQLIFVLDLSGGEKPGKPPNLRGPKTWSNQIIYPPGN